MNILSKKLHQNRGFTLVELTIAIALYSFLLLIVLGGFLGVFWIFNRVSVANKVQQEARTSIDVITRAVRFADSGTTPTRSFTDPTKAICIQGPEGRLIFFKAKTSTENYAIYQKTSDNCVVPDPNSVPGNEPSLQRLTSTSVNVDKFEPSKVDRSVELKVAVSSIASDIPEPERQARLRDRFDSYVDFWTVVNIRRE